MDREKYTFYVPIRLEALDLYNAYKELKYALEYMEDNNEVDVLDPVDVIYPDGNLIDKEDLLDLIHSDDD